MDDRSNQPAILSAEATRRRRKSKLPLTWLAISALLSSFLLSSCAPMYTLACSRGGSAALQDPFILREARFNVSSTAQYPIIPADEFWFSGKDSAAERTVNFGWDSAILLLSDGHAEGCELDAPRAGCDQCDFCTGPIAQCTSGLRLGPFGGPSIFVVNEKTGATVGSVGNPFAACLSRPPPFQGPSFEVTEEGRFLLKKPVNECGGNTVAADFTAHFVTTPQTTFGSDVEQYFDDDHALRYRFTYQLKPPANGGERPHFRLRENFSPRIIVTRVRVLLGTVSSEGVLGFSSRQDAATSRRVRPSRIIFLQNVLEGDVTHSGDERTHRCYFDSAQDDGGFDLTNCRSGPGGPVDRHFRATPAYLDEDPNLPLTWFLEYKVEDGLPVVPVFQVNEIPILEFTICNAAEGSPLRCEGSQ